MRKSTQENLYEVGNYREKLGVSLRTQMIIKRVFDIAVALTGMVTLSPVFLIAYIMIKREDGGPAIFSQERIGRYGKPFIIYKFRSMRIDAEADGAQLYHTGDERLTRVGAFLRAHHLDELPQFWNVVRGDMSFVGHRPERQVYIDEIMKHNPDYEKLYVVRPGVFSRATLYNGYTDTMEKMLKRLEMDLDYLKARSLWFDFKIISLTAISIISGKKF